ncbi:putative C6 finger domain protein [Aspergillus taichungensis]|uniref:Putative C6 finger domain protein n=1 Tax=Aspergillus taichungensis TaxID=482145 RepID=A0A2J5HFG9_9EURO|nr:putative C6 finger domain protein [Aspergillus taichungensis]
MSDHRDADPEHKDPPGIIAAKPGTRKKIRPTYSCLNCHKRKVKCDRVKPCGACCLRGTPSECEYGTMDTCESLKEQLAEARKLANLPPIKFEDVATGERSIYQIKRIDEDKASEGDDIADNHTSDHKQSSSNTTPDVQTAVDLSRQTKESSPPMLKEKNHLVDPAMAGSVMELFVERLITTFSPEDHTKFGGTIALREASEMRVFSPFLCNAFEAASLTVAGRRGQNRSIEIAGHSRYVRTLRQLQKALYDPKDSKSTEVLVVVLLATIVEAFKQTAKDSIFRHQLGGLALLRSRTPFRHRYGLERSLFVDLRLYWVTAALVQRQPTFMASKEWLTVPWAGNTPAKDILHRLLDVAVDIPEYLSRVDEFSARLRSGDIPPADLAVSQSQLWEQASELQNRLHAWKTVYADTYPPGTPLEDFDSPSPDEFPVFRWRNPLTLQTLPAKILIFPDILVATSLCFYWALSLVVSGTDSGLISVLSLQERYQFGCNICRSMKYYIQNIPGCLVSRIMFVLRAAFDSFADGMIEKEFMSDLFQHIGKRFNFPVFTNECTSSSVRAVSD